jgi:hypothetical protein
VSASAFVLVDAVLPVGNHTISEYLQAYSQGQVARCRTLSSQPYVRHGAYLLPAKGPVRPEWPVVRQITPAST